MKIILLFLHLCCCWALSAQSFTKEVPFELKGKVKMLYTTIVSLNPEITLDQNNDLYKHQKVYFDEQGKVVSRTLYKDDGQEDGTQVFSFDKKGFLTEVKITNKNNLLANEVRTLVYNKEKTEAITKRFVVAEMHTVYPTKYVFDKRKRPIEITDYFPNEKDIIQKERFEYNAAGKITANIKERMNGSVVINTFLTYNAQNQIVKELTEVTQNGSTIYKLEGTFAYTDKMGFPTEQVTVINGGAPTRCSYEYQWDAKGNWTEKRFVVNGKAMAAVKREITYY